MDSLLIGWDAYSQEYLGYTKREWRRFSEGCREDRVSADRRFQGYSSRGITSRVDFVIDSSLREGVHEFNPNKPSDARVIDVCKRWKARSILDKTYHDYGLTKRPARRPSTEFQKLRMGAGVILLARREGVLPGGLGKVVNVVEVSEKVWAYDVKLDDHSEILQKVPRKALTTYYLRDSTVMLDIFKARKRYKATVDHLGRLFCRVKILG